MNRRDDIRKRVDAGTPGPWAYEVHGDTDEWDVGVVWDADDAPLSGALEPGEGDVAESICTAGVDGSPADAALIAHAPSDLRDLLDVADAAARYRDARDTVTADRALNDLLDALARLDDQ